MHTSGIPETVSCLTYLYQRGKNHIPCILMHELQRNLHARAFGKNACINPCLCDFTAESPESSRMII